MLAGEPPFTGATHQAVLAKSISNPRPHVTRARPEVPAEVEQVALRAMAIDPAQRYPNMSSLGAALRGTRSAPDRSARRRMAVVGVLALLLAGAAGAWLARRPSPHRVAPAAELLAVLPFRTSGPGMEFLGEGMVDLLSTNLRGVGGINTVDPRAVLREWRGTRVRGSGEVTRALAVGRDLDAYSVVMGSVVSAGGRVRLAADLYTIDGERLGRAQVDAQADSVLGAVDRLSLALLRDVWRSREPLPNVRLASLTTDSIDALRSYLEGERQYRRLAFDSALAAYTRAVEVDSTFALAHQRRAQVFGWTGGYGNQGSRAAVAAANRFAARLPPRDRRLLIGYNLFEQGKPAAADSLRAFVKSYPEDVEGWFLLGEALHHTCSFRPTAPESVTAVFDSVLRRDSTLVPALIHPVELAVMYRDSAMFARYFPPMARNAPADRIRAIRTTAGLVWGPQPSDSAITAVFTFHPYWMRYATNSFYHRPGATSDTILQRSARIGRSVPPRPEFAATGLAVGAQVLAGLGRWRQALRVTDSLRSLDPEEAAGALAWPIALGLAPASFNPVLDSVVRRLPPGPEAEYAAAMLQLLRRQVPEGRRRIGQRLTVRNSQPMPGEIRGLMIAVDGWGAVLQGDSVAGIRRMREGLDLAAAPHMGEESAFLRFQLALALAARPETREEGIRWLRYGFQQLPLYLPITQLALGRAYEAAGQRDSAVQAYGRFLRFWDKADPELQARTREVREVLQELTRER
jgi:TolB-like protein